MGNFDKLIDVAHILARKLDEEGYLPDSELINLAVPRDETIDILHRDLNLEIENLRNIYEGFENKFYSERKQRIMMAFRYSGVSLVLAELAKSFKGFENKVATLEEYYAFFRDTYEDEATTPDEGVNELNQLKSNIRDGILHLKGNLDSALNDTYSPIVQISQSLKNVGIAYHLKEVLKGLEGFDSEIKELEELHKKSFDAYNIFRQQNTLSTPSQTSKFRDNLLKRMVTLRDHLESVKNTELTNKYRMMTAHKYAGVSYHLAETIDGLGGYENEYKELKNMHYDFQETYNYLAPKVTKGLN
ncbi:hypothetical protein CHCC5027_3569 [Bacillus paralicheniformis]|uniref:hypothetical protein n=1 Tax=Bacillus paralicheniformis TaxID=1648923 RepID=UPI0011A71DA3|nr:hypothetical protein [Bacillus paralicheniformis]TWJ39656.1 hypothetical protein CHCC5027_3569 [Bacillus paralicheniformis]